jgi:hypothetical protein
LHVSITTVDYDENSDAFTLSFKLFKDDLEKIVNHKYSTDLDIINCIFIDKDSLFLEKYILEHFSMKFDGKNALKRQEFLYTSCNDEAIWLYFKIIKTKPTQEIEIKNTLMTDLFNDQKNLLIFKFEDFEKGVQFNKKKDTMKFTL